MNAFVPWKPQLGLDDKTEFRPVQQTTSGNTGSPKERRDPEPFIPWKPEPKDGQQWKPVGVSESSRDKRDNVQPRIITLPLKKLEKKEDALNPLERQKEEVKRIERHYKIRGRTPPPPSNASNKKRQIGIGNDPTEEIPTASETYPPAATPTTEKSVAVNQDGFDLTYFIEVRVGSKEEPFKLVIDTGSSDTWVPSSTCETRACGVHEKFDFEQSDTFRNSLQDFGVQYGTGKVAGIVVQDRVEIGDFNFTAEFGLVTLLSNEFANFPIDGILGLGLSTASRMGVPTVMDRMYDDGIIKSKVFGVTLSRNLDDLNDGQISFGGIDAGKYNEPITYSPNVSPSGLWEVSVDKFQVGEFTLDVPRDTTALLDTGTSYMLIPPEYALMIHRRIPGAQSADSTYLIPCDTDIDLHFTIAGVRYSIPAVDYIGEPYRRGMCISRIAPSNIGGPNVWLLGATFLKTFYSVYDLENNQIGLALRKTREEVLELRASKSGSTPDSKKSAAVKANSQFKWLSLAGATAAWLI